MGLTPSELEHHLNSRYDADSFPDHTRNGLQVEGSRSITRIVTAVSVNDATIEAAIRAKADALVTHHGLYWSGDGPEVLGLRGQRTRKLIESGMSLLSYHLPMDGHMEIGNNVELARILGLRDPQPAFPLEGRPIGLIASATGTIDALQAKLLAHVEDYAPRGVRRLGRGRTQLERVAIVTGSGSSFLESAMDQGAQVLITGEVREPTHHDAHELGIWVLEAGHHATEVTGPMALAKELDGRQLHDTTLKASFANIPNPV